MQRRRSLHANLPYGYRVADLNIGDATPPDARFLELSARVESVACKH